MRYGLFRLIIFQEEPLLDIGQYITVTRFKTGHEISLPVRYVKRECDTKNVQNGRGEKDEDGRREEKLRATRAKRHPKWARSEKRSLSRQNRIGSYSCHG